MGWYPCQADHLKSEKGAAIRDIGKSVQVGTTLKEMTIPGFAD